MNDDFLKLISEYNNQTDIHNDESEVDTEIRADFDCCTECCRCMDVACCAMCV